MIDTSDGFLPLLEREACAHPDRLFARYEGIAITFGAVDRASARG